MQWIEIDRKALVHIVEKILKAFKAGTKDTAEFWITLQGRFIHIRYFAVRDKSGAYKDVSK